MRLGDATRDRQTEPRAGGHLAPAVRPIVVESDESLEDPLPGARWDAGAGVDDGDLVARSAAGQTDRHHGPLRRVLDCVVEEVQQKASEQIGVADERGLDDVAQLMEREQIRRVVVVDAKGCVAGIVAQADIALAGRAGKTAEVVKQVSEPGRSH